MLYLYKKGQQIISNMSSKLPDCAFVYPPNLQKSHQHRLSMRIFKGLDKDQTSLQCQCCQRRVGVDEEVGQCCYSKLQLAFLGPGLPLFFSFIKNSAILLLVLTIIFCVFALYSNVVTGDCEPTDKCSNNVFDTLSILNKTSAQDYLSIQNYILLAFVVLSFFIMQCFRYNFRSIEDVCDDIVDSPSDYAMILRRLPDQTTTRDIQEMIQDRRGYLNEVERQKTENLRVISIIISFRMGQYTEIKAKNIEMFENTIAEETTETFVPEPLPLLVTPANIAVVVFARQQSKQMFAYKPNVFQKILQCIWTPCIPRSDYRVKGQPVAIERAPEPDDIIWQNAGISMCGAITRKTFYGFLSIVVLVIGGAAQWGLAVLQKTYAKTDTEVLLMSTASSILVSILNAIIQIFLIFTSHKERNETKTEFNTVLMVKLSLFQFLNTGVFVLLSNFLANINEFTLDNGLVFQITQVMMINAVVPNLVILILNYFEIIQKIQRHFIEKGTSKKSQLEANKVFQGPEAEISYKYGYIFKTIWLTAFYAPLVPIVVPVSVVGLILNYFIQKCIYGKVYSTPNMLSSILNDAAIELLQFFPFILSIGQFLVYLYLRQFHFDLIPDYWAIPIYISLGISFLNLLLPMDDLNHKLCSLPFDNMIYPDYEKVEDKFQVTYEMTNPAYECKRKRSRDKFILNKLFGNGGPGIEMTNLFGNNTNMNMNMNEPLMQSYNQQYRQNQNQNPYQNPYQNQNQNQNPNMAAMGLAGFGMQNNNNNNHNHYENENEKFDSREYNEIQDSVYNGPLISDNESSRYESRRSMRNELKLKESK